MEYGEFLDRVKKEIRDCLPLSYENAEVIIDSVNKENNIRLDALIVKKEENGVFPCMYLNPYFEKMENEGWSFNYTLMLMGRAYHENMEKISGNGVQQYTEYEDIKDKITCQLINYELNSDYLKDKAYQKIHDMAAVYRIPVSVGGTSGVITVSDKFLSKHGITVEELHEQAMENMERQNDYKIDGISDILSMFCDDIPPETTPMYVITNKKMAYGAGVILNDRIRQQIAEKTGDFYVLPSSIDEVIAVPKDAFDSYEELEANVKEINASFVSPSDRLSDHVYEYNAKTHELTVCGRERKRDERLAEKNAEESTKKPAARKTQGRSR